MFDRLAELREKRENGENGFTLIELLVVVVIIGILIAIAVPLYLNYRKGANDKSAQSDLRGAVSQLEQCNSDNSTYPTGVDGSSGAISGTCTTQSVKLSDGTKVNYVPSATTGTVVSYMMASRSDNGGGKVYCYNSTAGGSVKAVSGTPTLAAATC